MIYLYVLFLPFLITNLACSYLFQVSKANTSVNEVMHTFVNSLTNKRETPEVKIWGRVFTLGQEG